ncbi:PLP-dependent aminotransferase family protein [Nocardioides sp.]|uniref:MocR-like transcription factor YczR n=1 Tax=Nocardioides sp. TaxID=35761 RepID=UPI002721291D|nr:PLP-dependent aminotransferase family protein [Nocardioides sp.]MDO9455433.1 PLP-dependent aminotransferase family protein [Nocardioides sp.]
MSQTISATRVATLVGAFDRSPAYAGLAEAMTELIGDGRIGLGVRLPSERDLTEVLDVSRTTVTRAYQLLRDGGYAEARRGSGTFTQVPGGRSRAHDRALVPGTGDGDTIDLNCAAASAPPGIAAAYAAAVTELPAYLGGHGYFPAGLPALQAAIAERYAARGLPTDPGQVVVTAGALAAAALVAQAFTGPRDRVLVESPVYPNATQAISNSGARLRAVPVDPGGWDLDAVGAALDEVRPTLAYLIPDFQNPTGHVMSEADRATYARHLRRTGTVAVVDEAHQSLALDGQEMPRPFAAFDPRTITLGSASKSHWGGLRLGWIRAPHEQVERLTRARLGLDLGAPVMEQLVLTRLLANDDVVERHRDRLREQRDALLAAITAHLPDWRFRRAGGGLAAWCELPLARGTALATEAERRGVVVAPGPAFAAEGGLDRFVRVPWSRPAPELEEAVRRLAAAWGVVREQGAAGPRRPARVMVA